MNRIDIPMVSYHMLRFLHRFGMLDRSLLLMGKIPGFAGDNPDRRLNC